MCRPPPEAYVHRIGRTGRAGRAGVAITLRRAARTAAAAQHRTAHEAENRNRSRFRPSRICASAASNRRGARCAKRSSRAASSRIAAIVESLAPKFDVLDVAAAAVKRAESPTGEKEEAEIPSIAARPASQSRGDHKSEHRNGPRAPMERSRPPKPGTTRSRPGETGRHLHRRRPQAENPAG